MKQFVIAQIGSSTEVISLVPHDGFVWKNRVYAEISELDNSFWVTAFGGTFEGLEDDPVGIINSVGHDGIPFSLSTDYNGLVEVENSFFWDQAAQVLYVRIYNDKALYQSPPVYTKGIAFGISNQADWKQEGFLDMTIGGIVYEPTLISSEINANLSAGNWIENFMVYSNFSLSLVNSDGRYDGNKVSLMNQTATILLAEIADDKDLALDDFRTIRSGRISNISYNGLDSAIIDVADSRKFWSDNVPVQVFIDSDFPDQGDINQEILSKSMPLVLGQCFKVPGYRLNPSSTNQTAVFQLMTTEYGLMTSVSQVWEAEASGPYKEITAYTVDLINGTITMTSTQYTGGEVFVDMVGISAGESNTPIEIAFFLIATFTAFILNESDTDIPAWEKAALAMTLTDCGYYIPLESGKLNEILDSILLTSGICMFIENGKLTCQRISLYDDYIETLLTQYDFREPPSYVYNDEQYASRVSMDYFNEYDSPPSTSRTITLYDRDQELFNEYGRRKLLSFESIAQYELEALAIAQERYDRQGFIPIELECQYNEDLGLSLFDAVRFEYTWNNRNLLPEILYRVTQIDPIKRTLVLSQYGPLEVTPSSIINMYRKSQGV